MSKKISFKMNKRDLTGKKVKALRQTGIVPGIVYGKDLEPIMIQAENNPLEKILEEVGYSTPLTLEIGDQKVFSILKNIDYDPVRRTIINFEFQAISANDPIDAEVEIKLINREASPANKAALVIMQVMESIEVRALPNDLPAEIEVDLMDLKAVGDRITLADLKLAKGVEFTDKEIDLELAIVNVYDPAQLEAQNEAAGGDAEDVSEVESEKGGAEVEETEAEADKQNSSETQSDKTK